MSRYINQVVKIDKSPVNAVQSPNITEAGTVRRLVVRRGQNKVETSQTGDMTGAALGWS